MRIFVVVGTRPEAIKMAPLYKCLRESGGIDARLISTGQHRQMLDQVFEWFDLKPDADLGLMKPNQTLASVISGGVAGLDDLIVREKPDVVLAQGDTTTVMAAALASFSREVPFGHVEAGLRTYSLNQPFPEEGFRQMTSRVTTYHFAPTERSAQCLRDERVGGHIHMVGNTVIDALLQTAASKAYLPEALVLARPRMVLITGHRRENIGQRFKDAFGAIATLASRFPDIDFVYPVHLNPNVRDVALEILSGLENIHLIAPVSYPEIVALQQRATLILTDSGGIQEEAPTFRVPVLVMRDHTERQEAVEAGVAKLVGAEPDRIVAEVSNLLKNEDARRVMMVDRNPFGDGHASERIRDLLLAVR
ncbi:non-hydrolyzing UDP-N-acetylglucosamine 2-epimerase [Hyphomonas sp.]|jgi:UDP-N-acetylglucosamine 2-epimerase (non-hydrolysing)|uniref:non-hydrolyzing UDP-N-acetylglucosamine 2-epimerase n=1 Tax=Hyphomonas sp. TaxID=87 RepID=UPI0037BED944